MSGGCNAHRGLRARGECGRIAAGFLALLDHGHRLLLTGDNFSRVQEAEQVIAWAYRWRRRLLEAIPEVALQCVDIEDHLGHVLVLVPEKCEMVEIA